MLTHTGSKAGKGGGPECLVESGGEAGGEGAVNGSQPGRRFCEPESLV